MSEEHKEGAQLDDSNSSDATETSSMAANSHINDAQSIPVPQPVKKKGFSDYKANFKLVFGSGFGKLALICAAVCIIILFGFGMHGIKGDSSTQTKREPSIQPVSVPKQKDSFAPTTVSEAQRHEEISAIEAKKAEQADTSYQSRFNPKVVPDPEKIKIDESDSFNVSISKLEEEYQRKRKETEKEEKIYKFRHDPQAPQGTNVPSTTRAGITGSALDSRNASNRSNGAQAQPSSAQKSTRTAQEERQAIQRYEQNLKRAEADRDRFIANVRKQTLNEAMALISGTGSGRGGINAMGAYSSIRYAPEEGHDVVQHNNGGVPSGDAARTSQEGEGNGTVLIKTGNMLYATLDSEVNTDDGDMVFATIRGGEWNGAKILGRIEQGNQNIRLHFTTMAPQDERPTMQINAVALREQDAKQGMAEEIDHHTLSRYSALAVSSLLAGFGRAYEQGAGRTFYSGNNVITQRDKPTEREVYASAVGEMGRAMASEVRRGFDRPSTYSTPANQGFGVYFLSDLVEGQ